MTIEDWQIFYEFYKSTYHERMQAPYLNFEFFNLVHEYRSILNPVIFFAEINQEKLLDLYAFKVKILYMEGIGARRLILIAYILNVVIIKALNIV